jgi:hypothetical protein
LFDNYEAFIWVAILAFLGPGLNLFAQPISLHPENPHYFLYQEKPTVLIASGKHYGSVINQDFDFDLYLETIHMAGFNHTRVFLIEYVDRLSSIRRLRHRVRTIPVDGAFGHRAFPQRGMRQHQRGDPSDAPPVISQLPVSSPPKNFPIAVGRDTPRSPMPNRRTSPRMTLLPVVREQV